MHRLWRPKAFYFLTVWLAFCLSLWAFWPLLSSFAAEKYLKNRLQRHLGGVLQIESLDWQDGRLLLYQPTLSSTYPNQEDRQKFHAEKIAISYDYSIWNRSLNIRLEFENPVFSLEFISELVLKALFNQKSKKFLFFYPEWHLSIPEGKIIQDHRPAMPMAFQMISGQGSIGNFSICFDDSPLGQSRLSGRLYCESSGEQIMQLSFDKAPLSQINHGLRLLPSSLRNLCITGGILDGSVMLKIAKRHHPKIEGELTLSDVSLEHPALNFKGRIAKAKLKRPHGASQFELLEPAFFCFDHGYCLSTSSGWFNFEDGGALALSLVGNWSYYQETYPLSLAAKGLCYYSKSPSGWSPFPEAIQMQVDTSIDQHASSLTINTLLGQATTELHFEGASLQLARLFPPLIDLRIQKELYGKQLIVDASSKLIKDEAKVDALIGLHESKGRHPYQMHLQMDLNQNFKLNRAEFQGKNLPLSKFVQPFLFADATMQLRGQADFKGSFSDKKLELELESKSLALESAQMSMEASSPPEEAAFKNYDFALKGRHSFDFASGAAKGEYILRKASLLDKRSQLAFNDISGSFTIQDRKIVAQKMAGYCCDLYLEGGLELSAKQNFEGVELLTLTLEKLNGNLLGIQQLLAQMQSQPAHAFCSWPLTGNVALSKGPHCLSLAFDDRGPHLQTRLSGSLSDGVLDCSAEDFALKELAWDFHYDHQAKQLSIENLQGTLFVGKPENAEEYQLAGKFIHFKDWQAGQGEFDLAIENKAIPAIRLCGQMHKAKLGRQELHCVRFDMPKTHFFGIAPRHFELALDSSLHLDRFNLDINFPLEQIAPYISCFGKTKLWSDVGLSSQRLSILENSQGNCQCLLSYHQKDDLFVCTLEGDQLQFGASPVDHFYLKGKKQANLWSIEQLEWDNLSLAADIQKENQKWNFNFLGFRWKKALLAGIKGEYLAHKQAFSGTVNLLEVDDFKTLIQKQNPLWIYFQADNAEYEQGKLLASNDLGFSCMGKWQQPEKGAFVFEGEIKGQNVAIQGYECESLQADCVFHAGDLSFNNLLLQDPSGFMNIDHLQLVRNDQGKWKLMAKTCQVTDWRPSLLRHENKHDAANYSPFLISQLKMCHLEGFLGEPASFTGAGELHFSNRGSQGKLQPLFDIPQETIERYGLELSALTPVGGTIFFNIHEAKFYPTRFKEMYSEGRQSKFILAHASTPSYMDFDGNLMLQVRLKHYNLLYKLAHLFNFNVTGSLQKPNFSIQKQSKKSFLRKYRS